MLTTLESGRNPDEEGSNMEKGNMYAKYVIASAAEVFSALGASMLASVGPLI